MATGSLARARHTIARMHQRAKQLEPVTAFGAFSGGAALGALERSGMLGTTIAGTLPIKPAVAAALLLGAGTKRSAVAAFCRGAGYGSLGAYGYNAGKSGSIIAGEEEVGADAEDDMLGF